MTSGNFALVSGGGLTGASITSVTGTGATRTVTASTGSGGGTLGLNLSSATGIRDIAGNNLPTAGPAVRRPGLHGHHAALLLDLRQHEPARRRRDGG